MPLRTYVIRHVGFEDLGLWNSPIATRSSIRYLQAGIDDLSRCITDEPDLLVVLGAPIGVYEEDQYPFIADELDVIRQRLERRRPLLGICLGAQMIAAAAGARVYPSRVKEIGWAPIALSEMGQASCLSRLASSNYVVLHWHGDTFDLPAGARLLASTSLVKHQAFSLNDNVLALQFHAEADPRTIESWLIGHCCELGLAKITPADLRRETKSLPGSFRSNSEDVIKAWLDQIGFR